MSEFNTAVTSNKPLFQIDAMLTAPEIILAPAANEIYKLTMQSVRDCVEGYVPDWSCELMLNFPTHFNGT